MPKIIFKEIKPKVKTFVLSETDIQKQILNYLLVTGWVAVRVNSSAQKVIDINRKPRYLVAYWIWNNLKSKANILLKKKYKPIKDYCNSGLPDVLGWRGGDSILIEVKKPGETKLSPAQVVFKDLCDAKKVNRITANSLDDVIDYINKEF